MSLKNVSTSYLIAYLDEMARWRIDLVRDEVLHAQFFILVAGFFLRDQEFYLTKTDYIAFLRPDMVGFEVCDELLGTVARIKEIGVP
ncbi:hypothetical protein OB919_17015 [Halobacteria archaeon AArc-curdl1]|uniref:Uncharacterized protein n=1 Tax=Natronosalvus hydrolyticus TaxID=2979988 RepID=A0AAP2ZAU7_9EURY|nr:hypothetical protein [Halobacteria archaeon AArc-curdl1]